MSERTEDPVERGDDPLTEIFHAARDLPPRSDGRISSRHVRTIRGF